MDTPASLPDVYPEPSPRRRTLGHVQVHGPGDLHPRMHHWHAPRANRWEELRVTRGPVTLCLLRPDDRRHEVLQTGESRWIAPGTRWKIGAIDAQASFELEIIADESSEAADPQVLRARVLDEASVARLDDAADLSRLLETLAPGCRCLIHAPLELVAPLLATIASCDARLCWHPLDADATHFTALLARSAAAIDLLDYLGRDHAVIEAALAGALRGDALRHRWLCNALARHLQIEEGLLFPTWLELGGNTRRVEELRREHRDLRQHIDRLAEPVSRRRFLLYLDGHDEKEEQLIYPDLARRLGTDAAAFTRRVVAHGPAELEGND